MTPTPDDEPPERLKKNHLPPHGITVFRQSEGCKWTTRHESEAGMTLSSEVTTLQSVASTH